MNEPRSVISLLHQFRQRKLVQWSMAYLAGAWLVLEAVDLLSAHFGWPVLVFRTVLAVLGVGFVGAIVIAWYHGEQGQQRVTGPELIMIAGILALAGGVLALVGLRSELETTEPRSGISNGPTTLAVPEEGSIAVLPFVNISPDPEQDFFSDGLTEEMLNMLARVPGLRVAARTSSFHFKAENVSMDSIARLLRVAHLLEGSVRKAGDRIRVTAQLIEAESGYHLWSDVYDRDLGDVFAVQEEIARSVLEALRANMPGLVDELPVTHRTPSIEAYNEYLLGRYHWNRRGRANVELAIGYFERAIALDSDYASAYAGLADAYSILGYYQYMPAREAFGRAARAVRRALDLDPDNPEDRKSVV